MNIGLTQKRSGVDNGSDYDRPTGSEEEDA